MGQMDSENNKVNVADEQADKSTERRNGFLKKLIIVLSVAIVATFIVFYVIYYRFSYQADKLAKDTARIYAFGSGEAMAYKMAPGYIEKYESTSKVLSVSDIQDIYIDKFRAYTSEQVGEIDKIECKVTGIQAVSNVEDLQQEFADNGVTGVTQYRSVDADWIVTGKDGAEVTIKVQECVLKCDDGWYVDYVRMPDDINSMSTPVDTGDADSEDTTEAETAE